MDALQGMHPALRSRIRGYGYEVYVHDTMDDTDENRKKIVQFIAQECVPVESINGGLSLFVCGTMTLGTMALSALMAGLNAESM